MIFLLISFFRDISYHHADAIKSFFVVIINNHRDYQLIICLTPTSFHFEAQELETNNIYFIFCNF